MYIQKGYAIARHLILLLCSELGPQPKGIEEKHVYLLNALERYFFMSFLYPLKYHVQFPTVNSMLTVFYSNSMHGSPHT